jgi:hypothetical protein
MAIYCIRCTDQAEAPLSIKLEVTRNQHRFWLSKKETSLIKNPGLSSGGRTKATPEFYCQDLISRSEAGGRRTRVFTKTACQADSKGTYLNTSVLFRSKRSPASFSEHGMSVFYSYPKQKTMFNPWINIPAGLVAGPVRPLPSEKFYVCAEVPSRLKPAFGLPLSPDLKRAERLMHTAVGLHLQKTQRAGYRFPRLNQGSSNPVL